MSSIDHYADDVSELSLVLPNIGPDSDSDSGTSAKESLAEQIRDIIEALKEVRSQLADQNKHLDALTEKYIKPTTQQPRVVYIDDYEWTDETEWLQEEWHRALIPDKARFRQIKDRFFETFQDPAGSRLEISAPSLAGHVVDSANRGSVETLAAAWPAYREPTPGISSDITFDSEDSLFTYDYFFACCPRRRRDSHDETNHPDLTAAHLVKMYEMGYTNEASLEFGTFAFMDLGSSLMEKSAILFGIPTTVQRPWGNRVCGRVIMICLDELPLIPVQTIAFVLWQLDNLGVAARFSRNMNPGLLCIEGFTSSWGKQELPSFFSINGVEVLALYFQLRWMKVGTNDLHNRGITDGILLQRDEGDLPNTHGNEPRDLKIREERHGFAMITTVDRAFPLYTLVNLANNMRILVGGEEDLYLDRKLQNMTARSYLRHNMMGLGMFLIFLSGTLEWIASQWINSLDQLDRTLHTSLAQMTREKRRTLMFDDDLSKSDQYFAVLQTLHMCTDWINGTLRDVRELCDNIEPILSARVDAVEIDRESLDALCGAVVADSEMHFQPLLDRIERKVEEVKGLRDGIFVTSVKKASKGTGLAENSRQQIRYILVFTVAIVFYLPMGFVTSFFGMHLFNLNDNPTASQTSFIIAFIVLSIAIYAIATGALLVVRDDEWVKTTLASWKLVATSLGIPSQRLPWPGSFNLFNKKKSGKEGAL